MTEFATVYIDTDTKYRLIAENNESSYLCCCGKSFQSLYDLVFHESRAHFIEFSRIVTKLKSLVDEFIVPEETIQQKLIEDDFTEEVLEDEDGDFDSNEQENTEETEIIRRLTESGFVSLKIKKEGEISSPQKLKKEEVDTVSLRKIVSRTPKKKRNAHSNVFSCTNCPLQFEKYNLLKEHERASHKFYCDFCGRNYSVKLNLKMHIFREHKGVRTYCSECGVQTTNLEEHIKKHQKDPIFMCDICGKEMRGRQRMNNHINRSHKSRFARFFCQHCNEGFRYMADLREHSIKHEPDRKEHKCPICSKAYKRRNEMRRHYLSHSGQKWPCLDCGREYAWQRGLWTHKKKGYCKGNLLK